VSCSPRRFARKPPARLLPCAAMDDLTERIATIESKIAQIKDYL
jgi:hypothetical protein